MSFQKSRILCVDDNQDSCELIELMLQSANSNYAVKTAASPEEALRLIETQPFDLYILDYQFPNVSGIELCRRIRESDSRAPIVFYTGMAYAAHREHAMAAGADAYLVKPTDLEKLTDTVKRLLSERMTRQTTKNSAYSFATQLHSNRLW